MLASISSRRPPALAEDGIAGPRGTAGSGVASGGNEAGVDRRALRELRASGGTAVPAAPRRGDVAAAASAESSESVVVLRSHSYLKRG